MPLYEYKCRKCGSTLETLQRINEPPLKECPKCRGSLEKILSPPALQFKGTGFYITDYVQKKNPEKESNPEEKPKGKKTHTAMDKKSSHPSSSDKK